MTETLTDSGAVKLKAGAGVSTTLTTDSADGSELTSFINQAEAYLAAVTRIDWVSLYSGLDADLRKILDDAASSHAAMAAISYDMSGYTFAQEAQVMLDFNYTRLDDAIKLLKEKVVSDFIQGN